MFTSCFRLVSGPDKHTRGDLLLKPSTQIKIIKDNIFDIMKEKQAKKMFLFVK